MLVNRKKGGEYLDCIVNHFDFDRFSSDDGEKMFFWGWQFMEDFNVKEKFSKFPQRIFLDTASPCGFLSDHKFVEKAKHFTKIYTICPWTAEFLNMNGVCSEAVNFPCPDKAYIKEIPNKENDVIYYGQLHSPLYVKLIKTISKFNYRFCSLSQIKLENLERVTDTNLTTTEKWNLLSRCNVSVGFNLLFPNQHHLETVKYYLDHYEINDDFKNLLCTNVMPQMKTRMIEAAASKTLMLIYKDDYNVIENWFEPNKHFLYWKNFQELEDRLMDVKNNFTSYLNIIQNAHIKAKDFSISNFWRKINE